MTKKITTMKRRAKGFVDEIHRDGRHYRAVNSFDSSCSLGTLRPSSGGLKSDIRRLSPGGRTALCDSVYHSIDPLATAHYDADRHGIPMAVLTFTDGRENNSTRGVRDVRTLISDLEFFPSNNCYFIIAGSARPRNGRCGSCAGTTTACTSRRRTSRRCSARSNASC